MAKIVADGETWFFGKQHIEVIGDGKAEKIRCKDEAFKEFAQHWISEGLGNIANGYYPESGTMLQAFAALTNLFVNYDDVKVEGDIGTIEQSGGTDVIY